MQTNQSVALVGGAWSTNIGNAFYNLGAEWLLNHVGLNAFFVPESPRWKAAVSHDYDLIADIKADLFVLVGPCLWRQLVYVYESTFDRIYSRGGRVAYLSAGMATYTKAEAQLVGEFLNRFPPLFISTRDEVTYKMIAPLTNAPVYSGLCTSMFLNDALTPPPLERPSYVVLNFDSAEPELAYSASGAATVVGNECRDFPVTLFGKEVIRTSNLSIDEGYNNIYTRPNVYHSDLPEGYCAILSRADAVYSERVHSCAAALIFGGRAQFVQVSGRSFEKRHYLFDRLGLSDIRNCLASLDMEYINHQKWRMLEFVKRVSVG